MGVGLVIYFLVLVFVCILGFGENWLDYVEPSNDEIVRHISLHELEYIFMTTPLM